MRCAVVRLQLEDEVPRVAAAGERHLLVRRQRLHRRQPHDGLQKVLEGQRDQLEPRLVLVDDAHAAPHEGERGEAQRELAVDQAEVSHQLAPLVVREQLVVVELRRVEHAALAMRVPRVDHAQRRLVTAQHGVHVRRVAEGHAEHVGGLEGRWVETLCEVVEHLGKRLADVLDVAWHHVPRDGDAHEDLKELLPVERVGAVVLLPREQKLLRTRSAWRGRAARLARRARVDVDEHLVESRAVARRARA